MTDVAVLLGCVLIGMMIGASGGLLALGLCRTAKKGGEQ